LGGEKPVLLEFWATWCPICAELLPKMKAVHARYGDRVDFVVVAVAVNESRASVKRHLESHDLPFHLPVDFGRQRHARVPGARDELRGGARWQGKSRLHGRGADQDWRRAAARRP